MPTYTPAEVDLDQGALEMSGLAEYEPTLVPEDHFADFEKTADAAVLPFAAGLSFTPVGDSGDAVIADEERYLRVTRPGTTPPVTSGSTTVSSASTTEFHRAPRAVLLTGEPWGRKGPFTTRKGRSGFTVRELLRRMNPAGSEWFRGGAGARGNTSPGHRFRRSKGRGEWRERQGRPGGGRVHRRVRMAHRQPARPPYR